MKPEDGKWIDLYALLDVEIDASEDTLRKSLRKYEAQSKDTLHRKFVAQCRRILLDADCRTRYNRLHAQHRAGNPAAMDFQTFLSVIHNSDVRRQMTAAAVASPTAVAAPSHLAITQTPVLSPTSVHLLTGVVATMLITFIQSGTTVLPGF